ncbi:MAG: ribosome assembly RNA-binding protein YhbY [Clostridiales bacterium]|jgi:RNA-binding protein|nr:ribosome assembly RNA-binding protein YhbY [Clostridiales bacterium]
MLTSKQRARLRAMANSLDTIFQVGKGGIEATLVKGVSDALEARELIKLRVLDNAAYSAREAADALAKATDSDVVSVIGSRFVLYRPSENNKTIIL